MDFGIKDIRLSNIIFRYKEMQTTSVGVKVKYNDIVKQVIPPKSFEIMMSQIKELFKDVLQGPLHIFYFDKDNDQIAVTSQEDYDIALNESEDQNFKFEIALDEGGIVMKQEVKQAMLIPETSNVASNYVPPSVIKPVENPPVPVKVPIITPAEEEKKESVKISADIKETPKEEKSIIQNSQEKRHQYLFGNQKKFQQESQKKLQQESQKSKL